MPKGVCIHQACYKYVSQVCVQCLISVNMLASVTHPLLVLTLVIRFWKESRGTSG